MYKKSTEEEVKMEDEVELNLLVDKRIQGYIAKSHPRKYPMKKRPNRDQEA